METITKHLRIFGRVQGVNYRDWCVTTATTMGMTGWVRNRKDGSVEAVATGTEEDMEAFIKACYQGPPVARVETIETAPGIREGLTRFERRQTI